MKTLMQMRETSKEDLPDIYCDLDQVLVAFIKGAEKVIGGDFATSDKDERWKAINQTKGFWANLDWMPGAKRLYQFIEKYDPYVLSAFSGRDPSSKNGKMKWLAKNTNWKKGRINLVMRSHKQRNLIRRSIITFEERPHTRDTRARDRQRCYKRSSVHGCLGGGNPSDI